MKASTRESERATAYPQARTTQLIIRRLADETLIYDEANYKALCLNSSAAYLFQHCDGKTPASVLAAKLSTHFKTQVKEEVVHHGLSQLSKEGLLRERVQTPRAVVSRRTMMKRTGVAAAVALPIVSAIIAPRAAQAATQGGTGAACTDGSQCSSGVCNGGVCQ